MFLNLLKWAVLIFGLFGIVIVVINKVQPSNKLPAQLLGVVGLKPA